MTQDTAGQPLTPVPPAPPSRMTLLLRRAMLWAAGVVVVFALGALANWWTQVRPRATQVADLSTQLAAAQQELATARPRATEADRLQVSLDQAQLQLLTLQALVLVNDARVALAQGDLSGTRLPALTADSALARLQTEAGPPRADDLSAMRERLSLALDEIGVDAFAAQRDLEVLANDLSALAKDLASQ